MDTVTGVSISPELRRRLAEAKNVFVLTGAGISAESGVPTFRGGGNSLVWKGMPFEVISSAGMLARNLEEVWAWFDYRRELLKTVEPNAGHRAIASWQDRFQNVNVVTQNIDGLHQKAGSREVIELHGSIWRARCATCHARYQIWQYEGRECMSCGDPLRPDVVLFGETLPAGAFEMATERALTADLCFVIGTSAIVYPAASLPDIARTSGAFLVEVNPERTPLSEYCDEVLTGKAGEIVPALSL